MEEAINENLEELQDIFAENKWLIGAVSLQALELVIYSKIVNETVTDNR